MWLGPLALWSRLPVNCKTEIEAFCYVWEGDLRFNRPTTLLLMCWHNTGRGHKEERLHWRNQVDNEPWILSSRFIVMQVSFKTANTTKPLFSCSSDCSQHAETYYCRHYESQLQTSLKLRSRGSWLNFKALSMHFAVSVTKYKFKVLNNTRFMRQLLGCFPIKILHGKHLLFINHHKCDLMIGIYPIADLYIEIIVHMDQVQH